jgi:probable F420-dependent oxidoreductase
VHPQGRELTDRGVGLPYWRGWPIGDLGRLAEAAQDLGYASAWASEVSGPDPFVVLAAAATRAPRLHLGTALVQAPARSPAITATAAASLAGLTTAGVTLGIGVSTRAIAEDWHGRPFPPPADGLREYVATVREVLAGAVTGVDGVHHRSHGYRSAVTPAAVRVVLGALADPMIRVVAGIGDGLVLGNVGPETVEVKAALLRETAGDPGMPVFVLVRCCVTDSIAGPVAWMQRELVRYCAVPAYVRLFRDAGHEEAVATVLDRAAAGDVAGARAAVDAALVTEVAAIGSAEDVRERLAAYERAGATVLVVPFDGAGAPALESALRTLSAVAPRAQTPMPR